MKQTIWKLAVAMVALAMGFQAAQAGEEVKTAAEQLNAYGTGWDVGVFGGASLFQSGHIQTTTPLLPGISAGSDTRSELNGVAGAHGGYTWSAFELAPGIKAAPALEGEFFYTGSDYKANGSVLGLPDSINTTLDAYVFSVDPKLKFQIGRFRPYVGFGVGAAYLTASNGNFAVEGTPIFSGGGLNNVVLALQGLAGLETFITKNWSIDVGYKYLDLVDPTFNSPGVVRYQGHSLTEQLVTAGVNFYF